MSRPWQFTQDHRSPLDRQPQGSQSSQAPSLGKNVNRAKTKKWVEAKSFSYDGDDWGDYDEEDEYGANAAPPPVPEQHALNAGAGRSFTNPQSQPPQSLGRKNSFDNGDERRAFSGPAPPQNRIDTRGPAYNLRNEENLIQSPSSMTSNPDPAFHSQQYPRSGQQQGHPSASRQSSAASWSQASETPSVNVEPQRRQDYNPSAMPQPLQPRLSPGPGDAPTARFPPRKSSIGQDDAPSIPYGSSEVTPTSSKQRTGSESSAPPNIIRPADIYKRIAEAREKERASMDSSRPSVDSLGNRPADDLGRSGRALESVAERRSEYIANPPAMQSQASAAPQVQNQAAASATGPSKRFSSSPELPEFSSSSFGDEFWSQAGYAPGPIPPSVQRQLSRKQPASSTAALSGQPANTRQTNTVSSDIQGVIDQAFTRKDDNSVPPTPTSRQTGSTSENGSSVSRSNTDSTSGISPIMSRVPSSAAAADRARAAEAKDMATPAIAEESPNASRRASATFQGLEQVPRRPDQATHSRTGSAGSIPQRHSLVSPSPTQSPARSPVIASTAHLRHPSAAEIDVASPVGTTMSKVPSSPNDYTVREADIAQAVNASPEKDVAHLVEQEKESQTAFLEQAREFPGSKPDTPRDRSESPTKGRVRDLAGKFDTDSRRNSVQSISSNKSDKISTPHVADERPAPAREESFRPKLPGQWESFVSTPGVSTPNEPEKQLHAAPEQKNYDEDIDLEPTTIKRSASQTPGISAPADAMSALAAAGVAMGESIKAAAAAGFGEPSSGGGHSRAIGEVQSRPLGPQRIESNLTESTIAPTPPPKDYDDFSGSFDEIRPVPPLKSREVTPVPEAPPVLRTNERPPNVPHLSTDMSPDDEESDRLRKEIVQTLSPITAESPEAAKLTQQLAPPQKASPRDSSVLPAEYDTFWGEAGGANTYPFRDVGPKPTSPETIVEAPALEKPVELDASTGPGHLDRRFSWEKPAPKTAEQPSIALPTQTSAAAPMPISSSSPLPPPPANIAVSDVSTRDTAGPAVNRGLHVLNTENPEAIEEPTYGRPRAEVSSLNVSSIHQDVATEPSVVAPTSSTGLPGSAAPAVDPARIPPFREILALKSTQERTQKYDSTREQFANMDTGLRHWLEVTIAQRPEHADVKDIAIRPVAAPAALPGSARHRHAPSLNVFSKMNQGGSSNKASFSHQPSANSPSSPAVSQGSPAGAAPGSSGGAKVQAKGKEFLQTAGLFGGKATTSAKGLFAKGKSRFKGSGDKVVE